MSGESNNEIAMTPTELGLFMAVNAIVLALKASPNFNNEALKALAERFISEKPSVLQSAVDTEAYERALRPLANNQAQVMDWLKQNGLA